MATTTSAVWLVELEVGGRTIRLCADDEPAAATDRAGVEHVYAAGGLLDEPDEIAVGDDGIALLLQLDAETLSRPLLVERAPIRLLRWLPGTVLEAATAYAVGRVAGLVYGATTDPVEVEIDTGYEAEDLPQIPDQDARVDDGVTWPDPSSASNVCPTSQQGLYYPVIYGFPGSVPGGYRHVVPVPYAQHRQTDVASCQTVLADGVLQAGTAGTTVEILNIGPELHEFTEQTWAAVQDQRGRWVTTADWVLDTTGQPSAIELDVQLLAAFTPSGGGGRFRDAYSVVVDVLRRWGGSVPIDWAELAAVQDVLSLYQVDTWINAPTTAWEWLEDVLLRQLPVTVRTGRRGRYLAWDRWYATRDDAVGSLSADRYECERRSPIRVSSAGLVNEVQMRCWRTYTGAWYGLRTLSAQDGSLTRTYGATDDRVLGHPLAAASQATYGLRRAEAPVDVSWSWDLATVLRVGHDLLERLAHPRRTVTYHLAYDPRSAGRGTVGGSGQRAGDVVLLTDTEVGLDEAVAIVSRPPLITATGALVELRLVPELGR